LFSLLENESPDVVVSDYVSAAPFEICRTKKTLGSKDFPFKNQGKFMSNKNDAEPDTVAVYFTRPLQKQRYKIS